MRKIALIKSLKFTHHKQQIQLYDGNKFALKTFLTRNKIPFNPKIMLNFNGNTYYLRSDSMTTLINYDYLEAERKIA
ncbi:MAG: hypothetical protein EBV15_04515 [Bacteroidetes bacterium]|nr:hypothetical protein [Bacteroidota bacterium]